MGERAKQLTNAVAASRADDVAGGAIGRSDPQRRSRVLKVGELRVFSKAREDAAPSVRHDEFECAGTGAVSDQPAIGSAAMFQDVVLQLAKRAHQTRRQASGQTHSNRNILHMLAPLIPEQVLDVPVGWIEPAQRKHAGPIPRSGAADRAVRPCPFNLTEDWRLDHNAPIDLGRSPASNGEFHQGADEARPNDGDRGQRRQPSGNSLPKQVVGCLEGRADAPVVTFVQDDPHLLPSVRLKHLPSPPKSERGNESSSVCCALEGPRSGRRQ